MKKLIAFLLAAVMIFALVGCGGSKTETKTEEPKTEAPKTETKTDAPKTEEPKTEAPKTEAPKTEIDPKNHAAELTLVPEVAATCTKDGVKAYYVCEKCLKTYSDAEGETEIAAPEAIPAFRRIPSRRIHAPFLLCSVPSCLPSSFPPHPLSLCPAVLLCTHIHTQPAGEVAVILKNSSGGRGFGPCQRCHRRPAEGTKASESGSTWQGRKRISMPAFFIPVGHCGADSGHLRPQPSQKPSAVVLFTLSVMFSLISFFLFSLIFGSSLNESCGKLFH